MSQDRAERRRLAAGAVLPRRWVRQLGLAAAVGLAYFFAAQLSLNLLSKPDGVAVFWPAAGVSAGVLIALGRSARLPVALGAMMATFVANIMGDRTLLSAIAFAFCNAGEALLTAWLIERYVGPRFTLGRLRHVLALLAAAVVATAVSGVGGTIAYMCFQSSTVSIITTWQHWFASDAVGIITVAPLLVGLAAGLRRPPPRSELIEGLVALVGLALMTGVIISLPPEPAPSWSRSPSWRRSPSASATSATPAFRWRIASSRRRPASWWWRCAPSCSPRSSPSAASTRPC
jgi:integral membrane sensor domain MASE1